MAQARNVREHEFVFRRIKRLGGLPLDCGCMKKLDVPAIEAQVAASSLEVVIPALLADLAVGHDCPRTPPPSAQKVIEAAEE